MRSTEIRLRRRPAGVMLAEDFALHDTVLAAPGEAEVLVQVRWLAIEPVLYERATGSRPGSPLAPVAIGGCMAGRGTGRVLAGALPRGTLVTGDLGWRSHAIVPVQALTVLPEGDDAPAETWALGVLGMAGLAAWTALFDVARVQQGEWLLVSSAAGTVGAIAAQLALQAGLRVAGIAAGPAKCRWLVERGITAVNRLDAAGLQGAIGAALDGRGFDVMLDLAGGDSLRAALPHARPRARIVLAGHVASLGEPAAQIDADLVLYRRLSVHGFLVHEHAARFDEARAALLAAARAQHLVVPQTVHEGLASAPGALQALLTGRGMGRHLVCVSAG